MSSWLLDLTAAAVPGPRTRRSPVRRQGVGLRRRALDGAGRGRRGGPAPVLVIRALFNRFVSRGEADFANKLLSAMRKQFGGHQEKS